MPGPNRGQCLTNEGGTWRLGSGCSRRGSVKTLACSQKASATEGRDYL